MNKKFVDLHTHSYRSDGTISPEAIVVLAKQMGLSAIALTDHDTLDGVAEFMEAGKKHDMETIVGIEIACTYPEFHKPELHIVGLGFDPTYPKLVSCLTDLQEARVKRNEEMIQKLCDIGLPCTVDELYKTAGGTIVARAHFAKLLIQKGYVTSWDEAFEKYIGAGTAAYIPKKLPNPQEIIELLHEAGGVVILAHPTLYKLDLDQLDSMCNDLSTVGLDGIECYYSTYTPVQQKNILHLAEKYSLLPSGGSDFHGANKPKIQLGTGMGNLAVPESCWVDLKAKL